MLAITNTKTGETCRGVFYHASECHVYARCQGMTSYTISKGGKVIETVGAA